MSKFDMIVVPEYRHEMCEVVRKSFTRFSVSGYQRTVYMLYGVRDNGKQATALVSKEQWEQFDVPAEEKAPRSRSEKKQDHEMVLESLETGKKKKSKAEKPKRYRRAYNEEIEKWLAERNGLDFSELVEKGIFKD